MASFPGHRRRKSTPGAVPRVTGTTVTERALYSSALSSCRLVLHWCQKSWLYCCYYSPPECLLSLVWVVHPFLGDLFVQCRYKFDRSRLSSLAIVLSPALLLSLDCSTICLLCVSKSNCTCVATFILIILSPLLGFLAFYDD